MRRFNLKANEHLHSSDSKRRFNVSHFTESAPRYDLATRLLSFGRDRVWKRKLVESLPLLARPSCVDIACGTGDVTFALAKKYPEGSILGVDLTEAMVDIASKRNSSTRITFLVNDMCDLDVASESVDILTGSYAIRNAPSLTSAIGEISRVVKSDGWIAFLDFSKPRSKVLQTIQYFVLKLWGSFCGIVLHANPEVHGYIAESIRDYPDYQKLQKMFQAAGFTLMKRRRLYLGMLEILVLQKKGASSL